MEKTDRCYWVSIADDIRNGKTIIIRLSDEQAIEEAISRGDSLEGIDYTVDSIRHFKNDSGLSELLLIGISDEGAEEPVLLTLVIKIVDGTIDMRIHYQDDEFTPSTREDLIAEGNLWLFEPDEDILHPYDLTYTKSFTQEIEAEGDDDTESIFPRLLEESFEFDLKPQGVLSGKSTVTPKESGVDDEELTLIAEYSSEDVLDNPEILVTEIGNAEGGGIITVMPGAIIDVSEITVLR